MNSPLNKRYLLWLGVLLLLLISAGCGSSPPDLETEMASPVGIRMMSTEFSESGAIPSKYTCDGDDISPQLSWSGVPDGAKSLVMIMDDPDAPVGTWIHWVLYGLPMDLTELPEAVQGIGIDGVNSWSRLGYGGPCPPTGTSHRYFFKLFALDKDLDLKPGAGVEEVEKAIEGHILASGQLMGIYARNNP